MNNKSSDCDVFILGSTGMLGNTLLRYFKSANKYNVLGSFRGSNPPKKMNFLEELLVNNIDIEDQNLIRDTLKSYKPKTVVNCIGLVKQIDQSTNPTKAIEINSLLPHKLFNICESIDARLVHISTDCVFDGIKGNYKESDTPNATDIYGRTKLMGEVVNSKSVTLRTSIIGHEILTSHSLLEWFLSQNKEINGYSNAVFSGLPTVELARVIHDFVIPNENLTGLYHVSSEPINKFDLLSLISKEYGKDIKINKDTKLVIDRSLNSEKFTGDTGFKASSWKDMIYEMYKFG